MLWDELIPQPLMQEMLAGKYIRTQVHPTEPLVIYNYTEKAMYEGMWNVATMNCRGLIVDYQTKEIIARPFPKFFNHNQPQAGKLDLSAPVEVTDKLDGSLGILYPTSDGGAIATRGSFTSEQALHATKIYKERYQGIYGPSYLTTPLFEIIYPDNRIVVDYGIADDLYFLGSVGVRTGHIYGPRISGTWPGPKARTFPYATLADALMAPPRPGAEGLVVRFTDTDKMVKIKQDDYLQLHKVLTNTNARTVWEFVAVTSCKDLVNSPKDWAKFLGIDPAIAERVLATGEDWLEKLTAQTPDEFHSWLNDLIKSLWDDFDEMGMSILSMYDAVKDRAAGSRREFALYAQGTEHPSALFNMLDGRPIAPYIWKALKPEADKPWGSRGEDVS